MMAHLEVDMDKARSTQEDTVNSPDDDALTQSHLFERRFYSKQSPGLNSSSQSVGSLTIIGRAETLAQQLKSQTPGNIVEPPSKLSQAESFSCGRQTGVDRQSSFEAREQSVGKPSPFISAISQESYESYSNSTQVEICLNAETFHGDYELDVERTAKREYNRVCAAKSRDKRRRTLSSLSTKVEAATLLLSDLLEKNKTLRDRIQGTFHETLNGLMGEERLGDDEKKMTCSGGISCSSR